MKYHYNLKLLFEDNVNEFKDNISIEYLDKKYTYKELNEKANIYVNYLLSQDIKKGDVIAIVSTKNFEDYALMIACLKSGIAYVNLDIENPDKRIVDIFKICQPKCLFSKIKINNIFDICKSLHINNVVYDDIYANKNKNLNLDYNVDGTTIAYIMFTSGSTGTPKGVAITHQNIIHLINWIKSRYNVQQSDKFANINPMYFDNSVFDFYGSLFTGASLVPVKKELLSQPTELVKYIDDTQCTIWFSVPSMLIYLTTMKVLNKFTLKDIRIFTFGGEGYPKSELKKLYDLYSDQASFINVYGPTECTCICSSYIITEKDFENYDELPSLGTINEKFSYIILDEEHNETDFGELCLFGPGVGIGYFNEYEKTNENFIPFTNSQHYKKRMYKTGDIVEERKGLLFFKGRIDNQIKHMGYRIELEEIEFALNGLVEVRQAVVLYKREKSAYGKIIAFVTVNDDKVDDKKIKQSLKDILPSYMIPSYIKILELLPKNQNGKIDKKVLVQEL